jgi:hypothetical protein
VGTLDVSRNWGAFQQIFERQQSSAPTEARPEPSVAEMVSRIEKLAEEVAARLLERLGQPSLSAADASALGALSAGFALGDADVTPGTEAELRRANVEGLHALEGSDAEVKSLMKLLGMFEQPLAIHLSELSGPSATDQYVLSLTKDGFHLSHVVFYTSSWDPDSLKGGGSFSDMVRLKETGFRKFPVVGTLRKGLEQINLDEIKTRLHGELATAEEAFMGGSLPTEWTRSTQDFYKEKHPHAQFV